MSELSRRRNNPAYCVLTGEREMATTALHALWDFLFDSTFIESSFETRPRHLRSLTTVDAFRRALHDFFAYVCIDHGADLVDRGAALHFLEDSVAVLAPEWAAESGDADAIDSGWHKYLDDDPFDDSWEDRVPAKEREWVDVCRFIDHLTEYDDLGIADYARQQMLDDGVPPEVVDEFLRTEFAEFARVSDRDLEAVGVAGCATPVDVPEDWSLADEPTEDQIEHDLFELTCRLYDGDGQPTAECWCWSMTGRYTEHQVNVYDGADRSRRSKDWVRTTVTVFRLADDSCDVRFVHKEHVVHMRTPPASWGKLARLDTVAEAWGKLIRVRPEPYVPIELEEVDDLETDGDLGDTA